MIGYTPVEDDLRALSASHEPPTPRQRYIDGLRVLASVLENHEGIPLPWDGTGSPISLNFLFGDRPREQMAGAARAFPCEWSKDFMSSRYGDYINLDGKVAGLSIRLTAYRDTVCKRVVTGTEDREVEEVVTPAVTRKVTETVDVIEWDCGSVLAPRLPGQAAKTVAA